MQLPPESESEWHTDIDIVILKGVKASVWSEFSLAGWPTRSKFPSTVGPSGAGPARIVLLKPRPCCSEQFDFWSADDANLKPGSLNPHLGVEVSDADYK